MGEIEKLTEMIVDDKLKDIKETIETLKDWEHFFTLKTNKINRNINSMSYNIKSLTTSLESKDKLDLKTLTKEKTL